LLHPYIRPDIENATGFFYERKQSSIDAGSEKAPAGRSKSKAPQSIIESGMGGTITPEEILSRIPKDVDTVYVKPEDNKAYWVKGDETDSVDLW
jgi:hypothetical protein